MPDSTISSAPLATLAGTEKIPLSQAGAKGHTTPEALKAFVGSVELLTADRNYYVRTDGNDSNTGLVNTSGGAFLTINRAIAATAALFQGAYTVTINIADGTYPVIVGAASAPKYKIVGNVVNPENVILPQINVERSTVEIAGVTLTARVDISTGAKVYIHDCRTAYISTSTNSVCFAQNIKVLAGSDVFASAAAFSVLELYAVDIPTSVSFSGSFAAATAGAWVVFDDQPTGTATGKRYEVTGNGFMETYGGGASFLPGSVAGTTATGGQYV